MKNKKLKLALWLLVLNCYVAVSQVKVANANTINLSYSLNTKWQLGKTVDVIGVVVKLKRSDKSNYVWLVKQNTTYCVKIADKQLYSLIKERDKLVLKNCTYESNNIQ